jgi:hypothetical protein
LIDTPSNLLGSNAANSKTDALEALQHHHLLITDIIMKDFKGDKDAVVETETAVVGLLQPPPPPRHPFPFATVVVTFPDEAAAQAADTGPLVAIRQRPIYVQTTRIVATADPYGARVVWT